MAALDMREEHSNLKAKRTIQHSNEVETKARLNKL